MMKKRKILSVGLTVALAAGMISLPVGTNAAINQTYYYDFAAEHIYVPYGDTAMRNGIDADYIYDRDSDANAGNVGYIAEYRIPSTDYIKEAKVRIKVKWGWEPYETELTIYPYASGWDERTVTYNNQADNLAAIGWDGTKFDTEKAIVPAATYSFTKEAEITSDITEYVKSLDTNEFGLLFDISKAQTFYQKDATTGGSYGNSAYLSITYDVETLLSDINSATEETIGDIISENGQLIGINASAYNAIYDKSSINSALVGKNFTTCEDATKAANNAIEELVYYVGTDGKIPVITNKTGTVWSQGIAEAGFIDYIDNVDQLYITADYSAYPEEYRAVSRFNIKANSGRHTADLLATQEFIDKTNMKNVGYISIPNTHNYYGGYLNTTENVTFGLKQFEADNECIDNVQNSYFELGYDKTGILNAVNSADSVSAVKTILNEYGYMLNSSITGNFIGKAAIAFYYADVVTLDNIDDIVANADETAAANLLPMINECQTEEEFENIAIEYSDVLGIDLTIYNRLSNTDDVFSSIYALKGEGFESMDFIKDEFNRIISEKLSTTPVRVIAYEDYNVGDGTINNVTNWAEALLTKFRIGNAANITSKHNAKIDFSFKNGAHSQEPAKERNYFIYEISPEGWNDTDPTDVNVVRNLEAYKDESKLIAAGSVYKESAMQTTIDVTDYFLDENGKFIKVADEDFAIKFRYDGSDFFAAADESNVKYCEYLSFVYDTEAILDEINNADTNNIEEIILREGSVIGINVTAYSNLEYKDEVNNALIGKDFANVAEAAAAANTALEGLFYSEVISMKGTGWGIYSLIENKVTNENPVDFWLSYGNNFTNYFTYDISNMTYDKNDAVYAEMNLSTRNLNEDTELRYLQFKDSNMNVIGSGYNTAVGEGSITGDVTQILKSADTNSITVYSTAPILDGGRALLQTPIFSTDGAEYKEDRFFITVYYNKLDIANKIADCDDVLDANNLFTQYASLLGLEGVADFTNYSTVFAGQEIKTLAQLDELILKAETAGVMISNINAGNITPGMTTTSGSVTIANFTGSRKKIAAIIASYDSDGRMVDSIILDTYDPDFEASLLPSRGETYYFNNLNIENAAEIRGFVWDAFETMNPYDTHYIYTING